MDRLVVEAKFILDLEKLRVFFQANASDTSIASVALAFDVLSSYKPMYIGEVSISLYLEGVERAAGDIASTFGGLLNGPRANYYCHLEEMFGICHTMLWNSKYLQTKISDKVILSEFAALVNSTNW